MRNRPNKLITSGKPALTDGDMPYSQAELLRMNQRFVERLKRAIRAGKEVARP